MLKRFLKERCLKMIWKQSHREPDILTVNNSRLQKQSHLKYLISFSRYTSRIHMDIIIFWGNEYLVGDFRILVELDFKTNSYSLMALKVLPQLELIRQQPVLPADRNGGGSCNRSFRCNHARPIIAFFWSGMQKAETAAVVLYMLQGVNSFPV